MSSSPKYKILFLVSIFEAPECVEDLIQNFHSVAPNSGILFHINSNCSDEFCDKIAKLTDFYDFCYILPKRFPSEWASGYLTHVFVESMRWAVENKISDYVYLTHSNSLLINTQLEQNIYDYDIYFPIAGPKNSGDWWEYITLDAKIFDYVSQYDHTIYCTAIEGSAMKLNIAKYFVDELTNFLPSKNVKYPSEEYYLPSAWMKAKDNYKSWFNGSLERWGHTSDHVVAHYQLSVKDNQEYMLSFVLNNQMDVLTKLNLYSIKKIERKYNTPARVLLRKHFHYHNLVLECETPLKREILTNDLS